MLTQRQHDLLVVIDKRIRDTGVCPSFEEMMDAVGLRSKSSIHQMLERIETRGFIRRMRGCRRAIEVIRVPGVTEEAAGAPADASEAIRALRVATRALERLSKRILFDEVDAAALSMARTVTRRLSNTRC